MEKKNFFFFLEGSNFAAAEGNRKALTRYDTTNGNTHTRQPSRLLARENVLHKMT